MDLRLLTHYSSLISFSGLCDLTPTLLIFHSTVFVWTCNVLCSFLQPPFLFFYLSFFQLSLCFNPLGSSLKARQRLFVVKNGSVYSDDNCFWLNCQMEFGESTEHVIRFDKTLWTFTEDQINLSFRGVIWSGRMKEPKSGPFIIGIIVFYYCT